MDEVFVDLRNENRWIREAFDNKDMVSVEDMLIKVEDLLDEVEHIKEEYEDFKRNVEDNYERIPVAEQIGVSDSWFI